jgi:glycosyltransferase involved in cell wall biosynthesis
MSRFLMLVSAHAGDGLRGEVSGGRRPCPEYLRLEHRHGVELLDWSRLGTPPNGRSVTASVRHARAALPRLPLFDAVFSDGEHVGVPLALEMRWRRLQIPHLMLGHHLSTRAKRPVFRYLRPQARMSRVLVHSCRQLELAGSELTISPDRLAFVQYGVDTDFWSPRPGQEEALVLAVGREHRDYGTLVAACEGLPARVVVAAGSLFSPRAHQAGPGAWPANFDVAFAEPVRLRELYARASVVVVPLVPNDFQAGVTVILEAMAMAKPVVVTATPSQRDLIDDGVTGVLVPAGDPARMGDAIAGLLASTAERRRLGDNARAAADPAFGLDVYADALAGHLAEISRPTSAAR